MLESKPKQISLGCRVSLGLIIAATLSFGLWPGKAASINCIEFTADALGLEFRPPSQAVSDHHVWSPTDEATLELWFEPAAPIADGNVEIIAYWEDGRALVVLGQWPGGFYTHSYRDNPGGFPELDRYVRVEPRDGLRHAAITVTAKGFALSIDGKKTSLFTPWRRIEVGQEFAARLLLGNSSSSEKGFAGRIHAVVIHEAVLSQEKLRQRAMLPVAEIPAGTGSEASVTSYRFGDGSRAGLLRSPETAPELLHPERVKAPDPTILKFSLSARWPWADVILDLLINVLGFMPLGLIVAISCSRRSLMAALLAGFLLSLAIELTQFWLPGRASSGIDLICNAFGAWMGAWLVRRFRLS